MTSPLLQDRTYLMGYWPTEDNPKRSLRYYRQLHEKSIALISGGNLVFMSDCPDTIAATTAFAEKHDVRLHVITRAVVDLPKYPLMPKLYDLSVAFGEALPDNASKRSGDKGIIHYLRDLKGTSRETFEKVFGIWHSKIALLDEIAKANVFETSTFAWIDFSIARFVGKREAWNFNLIDAARDDAIYHYRSPMKKNGTRLPLNASCLLGQTAAIDWLNQTYDAAFKTALTEVYPNDEETVLADVHRDNRAKFITITDEMIA
ncbi:hypothetical protein [Yoonia litorea]|uniref:Uncharacterized protein n=1 Tax=Yoonia litorea TaxID=1123755 RepID=A0A1I6MC08_9RHOB|nr:hypothetical protein [Yoonia litorea]SFS13244.1 hypothetical protein SAMN05444714_1512 [Yoonia litorea]